MNRKFSPSSANSVVAAFALTVVVAASPLTGASAAEPTTDLVNAGEAVGAIESLDTVQEATRADGEPTLIDGIAPVDASGNVSAVVAGDSTIQVPLTSDIPMTVVASNGNSFTITLPFGGDGTPAPVELTATSGAEVAVFDNGNASWTVPVVKDAGAVQITTVIENSTAPLEYPYEFGNTGASQFLILDDGAVVLVDPAGMVTGWVGVPWAKDATGVDVPTWYEVRGTTLVQVVAHNDGFTYPIVADPYTGAGDFYERAWITFPAGGYVVNAIPTAEGRRLNATNVLGVHLAQLKGELGSLSSWVTPSIREQFYCHVVGNAFEPGTYNMESWRKYADWGTQLNLWDQCNPPAA